MISLMNPKITKLDRIGNNDDFLQTSVPLPYLVVMAESGNNETEETSDVETKFHDDGKFEFFCCLFLVNFMKIL